MTEKIFADRLNEAMKAAGMTRAELAKESQVTGSSIYRLQNAQNIPNLYTALQIADVLGVSLDWLAGRSNYGSKEA